MGDYFKGVALVDQELLSLSGVEHFLSVFGHKGVKEGIEPFIVSTLGPKDSA